MSAIDRHFSNVAAANKPATLAREPVTAKAPDGKLIVEAAPPRKPNVKPKTFKKAPKPAAAQRPKHPPSMLRPTKPVKPVQSKPGKKPLKVSDKPLVPPVPRQATPPVAKPTNKLPKPNVTPTHPAAKPKPTNVAPKPAAPPPPVEAPKKEGLFHHLGSKIANWWHGLKPHQQHTYTEIHPKSPITAVHTGAKVPKNVDHEAAANYHNRLSNYHAEARDKHYAAAVKHMKAGNKDLATKHKAASDKHLVLQEKHHRLAQKHDFLVYPNDTTHQQNMDAGKNIVKQNLTKPPKAPTPTNKHLRVPGKT